MDSPLTLVRRLRADPWRRDVVDATVTAVVGLLCIPVGLVDIMGGLPWSVPPWAQAPWWHAVPLVLGCLALLLKRRRPLTTVALVLPLVALDVSIGASVGVYVVLLDALYSLVLHGPTHWIKPVLTAVAVPVVGGPLVTFVVTGDTRWAALVLLQAFALLGTPIWWGLSVRQQARLAELARARTDDLQRLSDLRRESAVRDERSRMAQDLHDALSSHLSTIAIHSQVVSSQGGAANRSIAEIRSASVRALEDLREMIVLLRTGQDQIVPAAGLADLDALVLTARGTGLHVEVTVQPDSLPERPSVVDQAAYRILQESLANAAKHAPGSVVEVEVAAGDQVLALGVRSRPRPAARHTVPPVVTGSGLGLQTMRDRAGTLGGSFTAGPQQDGSWLVRAELPLAEVPVA